MFAQRRVCVADSIVYDQKIDVSTLRGSVI